MARIRSIKPAIARHEGLFELELETGLPMRFAWVMLFCACDKEGRFRWQPRVLELDVLPFDKVDFSRVLDAWATRGFVVKYRVGNNWYGCIPSWRKHQVINNRETDSELPGVDEADEVANPEHHIKPQVADACATRAPRVTEVPTPRQGNAQGEGEREGEGERIEKASPSGSRLAKDWTLPDEWRTWATEQGMARREVERQADVFADYWRAKAGKDARKTDWQATWRNWVRRSMQGGHGNGNGGGRQQHNEAPPPRPFPVERYR